MDNHEDLAPIPKFVRSSLLSNFFHNREWNNKQNVGFVQDEIGFDLLKVLRDVGVDKLKGAIESRNDINANDKKKLKEYAEEITRFIYFKESTCEDNINNIIDYSTEHYNEKDEEYRKKVLKLDHEKNFPYVEIPNWKYIFEFMKRVFPIKGGSGSDYHAVKSQSYLDDKNDANFLKPSSGKKG